MTCLSRHRGEVEVLLQHIRNLGARREWVVSITPRPFYPGKRHTAGWALGPVWTVRKIPPPSGFDPRTAQSKVSPYIVYAILPAK